MRRSAQRQNFKATAVTGHKNRNVFKINSIWAAMKIGGIMVRPRYSGLLLSPESALKPRHRSSRRCVPYRLRSSLIYYWQNTLFQELVDSSMHKKKCFLLPKIGTYLWHKWLKEIFFSLPSLFVRGETFRSSEQIKQWNWSCLIKCVCKGSSGDVFLLYNKQAPRVTTMTLCPIWM